MKTTRSIGFTHCVELAVSHCLRLVPNRLPVQCLKSLIDLLVYIESVLVDSCRVFRQLGNSSLRF